MKKLFCMCLCLLLLAGCGQKAPEHAEANTTAVQPPAPDPTPTGVYLLTEQLHYDPNDRINVRMTVSFNGQMLPTSVFLDSGTDITYTPEYDENAAVTGFSVNRLLYGEESKSSAVLNEYGDIVQQVTDGKTTDIAYTYNENGLVIKKETSVNGNLSSVKTWSYDCWGNLTRAGSTAANSSYTLIYDNTYDGQLLTAVVCTFENGETEHTERFTYNEAGQLTCWEQISGDETTTTVYTYNDAGLTATETTSLNGEEYSRLEFSYHENGLLSEKRTYNNGEFTGRTTYSWTDQPVALTAAQRNALKQLGVLL